MGKLVSGPFKREELLQQVRDADAILVRVETKVDRELLEAAKDLKVIASMSTGLNHIDIDSAKSRGIHVLNKPGYATLATAQYTMGLILCLSRNIPWAAENLKHGEWARHQYLGEELDGKTIGLVGFGKIGRKVGEYSASFGMKVLFYDPYSNVEPPFWAERVTSLSEIFSRCDYITLHSPLSQETKALIRKDTIAKMKKRVRIINTSRGAMVNDSDLIQALEDGSIAGAALDVFSDEPIAKTNILLHYARSHRNLLLTPHIAGSTQQSVETAAGHIVDEVVRILQV